MSLNIPNLDKLIAHLEAQPPERINMGRIGAPECGTPGCLMGHSHWVFGQALLVKTLDVPFEADRRLINPPDWLQEREGGLRYPMPRVIATLKRLRDTFLATGQIVVDWGPEPGEEPKAVWAPPQAIEAAAGLPVELTRFLAAPVPASSDA